MPEARSAYPAVRRTTPQLRLPGERRNLAKSAVRALDVIEYFSIVQRPLRATDIAHALDLHPSSADQLLKTMVDSAYLLIDPFDKLYYPSPRLLRFTTWFSTTCYNGDSLCRLIEALGAETGQIVTLAAPQGLSLQIIDVVEPIGSTIMIRKGSRVPVLGSALGVAFLAVCGDHDVARWIRRAPEACRMNDAELKDLMNSVRTARAAGYSCGLNDREDMYSIAIPLPKSAMQAQLILGLAGDCSYIAPRHEQLVQIMRKVAEDHLAQ
jgi:DNA-binding IclR family transcriptional regulator